MYKYGIDAANGCHHISTYVHIDIFHYRTDNRATLYGMYMYIIIKYIFILCIECVHYEYFDQFYCSVSYIFDKYDMPHLYMCRI